MPGWKCQDCGQIAGEIDSCPFPIARVSCASPFLIDKDGKSYSREIFLDVPEDRASDIDSEECCPDCGVSIQPGNIHHAGCGS